MEKDIRITVIRSNRKTLALRVVGPDALEVRAPLRLSQRQIEDYLRQNAAWIEKHLALYQKRQAEKEKLAPFTEQEIRELGRQALEQLPPRVRLFADLMGVSYGRITIRNQKTRWGSCSGKGNLNFNCLLMLCPLDVRDYVIAHELCHRKHMDHSPAFWTEVERVLPDYKQRRDWLKKEGQKLIERLP